MSDAARRPPTAAPDGGSGVGLAHGSATGAAADDGAGRGAGAGVPAEPGLRGDAETGAARLGLIAPLGLPEVRPGDDLAGLILAALDRAGLAPAQGDVLVVTQKVVSKAEGRLVALDTVAVSPEAAALAARTGKDPRLVELILRESVRVLRAVPSVLIVEHRLGLVMANAGIDQSNLPPAEPPGPGAARDGAHAAAGDGRTENEATQGKTAVGGSAGPDRALLLPRDPDASAAALRREIAARTGCAVGVVVADSAGRAWRRGTVGIAIGVAGLPALEDLRGRPDRTRRLLAVKRVALADQIASAGLLLIGEADEGRPVALLRGLLPRPGPDGPAAAEGAGDGARALLRPPGEDLFR